MIPKSWVSVLSHGLFLDDLDIFGWLMMENPNLKISVNQRAFDWALASIAFCIRTRPGNHGTSQSKMENPNLKWMI